MSQWSNRMTVTANIASNVPKDAAVGDEYEIRGLVRVTGITETLVDVTPRSPKPTVVPGDREIVLLIYVKDWKRS